METPGTSPASAANFRMIDIAEKKDTQRRAVASGAFFAAASTLRRIRDRTLPKGDVLVLAEVAGIQGAKLTASLLPLCHPLSLTSVRVWTECLDDRISVFCEAKTLGKTGVEMEALCGVNAALLCIYDLTKGIDPVLRIGEIKLEIKEGGKSGCWIHPGPEEVQAQEEGLLQGAVCAVITLSDRCSRGEAEDRSGPMAAKWMESQGGQLLSLAVLPDDAHRLRERLVALLENPAPGLILTTGGTGLSRRDITPETVLALSQELGGREVPGFGELLRREGARHTEMSWLSRSTAVMIRRTLILCLPGSPRAVEQGLRSVGSLIRHSIHIMADGGHP